MDAHEFKEKLDALEDKYRQIFRNQKQIAIVAVIIALMAGFLAGAAWQYTTIDRITVVPMTRGIDT